MAMTQLERNAKYRASRKYTGPHGLFLKHRQNARARGVEFTLTFEEWNDVWQKSGKWRKRGNRSGRYVMGRMGDEGPYAKGNVYIILFNANIGERNQTVVRKKHTARSTRVTFHPDGITDTVVGASEAPF